jgi:hypothetical protein
MSSTASAVSIGRPPRRRWPSQLFHETAPITRFRLQSRRADVEHISLGVVLWKCCTGGQVQRLLVDPEGGVGGPRSAYPDRRPAPLWCPRHYGHLGQAAAIDAPIPTGPPGCAGGGLLHHGRLFAFSTWRSAVPLSARLHHEPDARLQRVRPGSGRSQNHP